VSPDGRFLSFTDWEAGGNLAIYDLTTGQTQQLTSDGDLTDPGRGYAEYSVPSPDGRSVAYAWFGETYDLRVVGLDGSKPRVLRVSGDGVVRQYPLAWSPDGRHVLAEIMKADGTRDMMLVAAADGSAKLLKAMGRNESPGGVFSPDGRHIAWATMEGLSLFDLQTEKESPLIADQSKHSVLGWAPDGKHILFSSERAGSADAWLIAVAGGKAQGEPIFVMKGWGFRPMGFTRSGAFYYAVNNNVGDVQIAEIDPGSGKVVSPPQSASRHGNTRSPDWSRDGRFLAYIDSSELPSRAVIVRSMDSGEEREIRAGEWSVANGFGGLRWAPDGNAVIVPASAPGKGDHLIRLDVQTGKVTPLMPLPGRGSFQRYDLSPDGHTVFYVDMNEGRLVAHDTRSDGETEVFKDPGLFCGVVSPDGRRLIIGTGDGQSQVLSAMPVGGGELRELAKVGGEGGLPYWGSPWWTPDGRHVAFLKGVKGKDLQWQLWRVAAEGGESQRLALTLPGRIISGPRPHPDGRRLAISSYKANLEVWVMENFLPVVKSAK
jgi:Tol biopolymer transport system component